MAAMGLTVSVAIVVGGCAAAVIVVSECQKEGNRCRPAVQRVVFCEVVCIIRLRFRVV